ncbi:hypothetical protein [Escherichia coli]|uniref:hypothetical protein n=1 Tax=Escherichia coli TaxID=562 RepID=UPI00388D1E83
MLKAELLASVVSFLCFRGMNNGSQQKAAGFFGAVSPFKLAERGMPVFAVKGC